MKKILKTAVLGAAIVFAASVTSYAQVPFCTFFDSTDIDLTTTSFDGVPVPVGSIIEAFDPDGVSCGKDTVLYEGIFGFMPVIGDDLGTAGIDEGAVDGDTIRFTINGRTTLVIEGDPTWTDQAVKEVELSASSTNIAVTGVVYPRDTLVGFNTTIRVQVGVRNDGDGLDFYGVNAISFKGWNITPQQDFVYANPNDTVFIYFDVDVPLWPGADTTDFISYSVFSYLDTSKHVDSSLTMRSSITVGVEDEFGNLLPTGYVLQQNYPNPFNPTTNISFVLPVRTDVRLQIYDILGREVELIDMGSRAAGEHVIEFDGSSLSSGVYFYRLITEEFVETRKMMLVK